MSMNVYVELTRAFNDGALRAILSSGQAVVLHKLAVMSKDGDWILREDDACLGHILDVLAGQQARYRFGAPLDARWMAGGWSAHFEFRRDGLRVRTDFVTRPPRISAKRLAAMWDRPAGSDVPFVGVRDLVELKKTNREKDYAVIGELARRLDDPVDRMLASRSARDLLRMAEENPECAARLVVRRPALAALSAGCDALEAALDHERRLLMRANEERLRAYMAASEAWAAAWPSVERETDGLSLPDAHRIVVARAESTLPFRVGGIAP